MARKRKPIPSATKTSILTKCRRRCSLCYGLDNDLSEKQGQLAHINRKRDDHREENLAYLCQSHHDRYDSTPSQTLKLSTGELRKYKERLEEVMALEGRQDLVQAEVVIEGSYSDFSNEDCLQLVEKLAKRVDGKIVLRDKRTGSIKLILELEGHDLKNLIREFDSGKLADLSVTKVAPVTRQSIDRFDFYSNFGILGTFPKDETVRLFGDATYVYRKPLTDKTLSVNVRLNPTDPTLATIVIGTIANGEVGVGEALVVSKDDVSQWNPSKPLELLQTFVEERGGQFYVAGTREIARLLINFKFQMPTLLVDQIGFREVFEDQFPSLTPQDYGRFYWDLSTIGRDTIVNYMYLIPKPAAKKMVNLAKSNSWF